MQVKIDEVLIKRLTVAQLKYTAGFVDDKELDEDGQYHWEWSDDTWDAVHCAHLLCVVMLNIDLEKDTDRMNELLNTKPYEKKGGIPIDNLSQYGEGVAPEFYDLKPPALED